MFRNYLKIAWRNLAKRKVFTGINILGLALGFGSSILIFLFLNYHISFDNFHTNSDRIYRAVTENYQDKVDYNASVPPGFTKAFREDYQFAEKASKVYTWENGQISISEGTNSTRIKEDVIFAEPEFFEILTFPLNQTNNTRSLKEPNTAYITENLSQKIFGTTKSLGKTFLFDNYETIEIIGILQNLPKTSLIEDELFLSFKTLEGFNHFASKESWDGISSDLHSFILLYPGLNIAEIENALLELPKKHRSDRQNKHVYRLQALSDVHFDPLYGGLDPIILWVFAIIGLFLISIACINFINISTAQAYYRSKEIGVRKVLGSFKHHLFFQFLCEAFLISIIAIVLGVILAIIFLPSFNDLFQLQLSLYNLLNIEFFGFLLLLLALVSLLAGSYPGLLMSRIVPVLALKGKLSHKATGGSTTRKMLVVFQFTISIILIVVTLIISKQVEYSMNTDLGFDKESILMVGIPATNEPEPLKLESLKERIGQINGVQKVTACLSSPGASVNRWGTNVKYHNRPELEEFSIQAKLGDENYLDTFDIPLVAGRNFFKRDSTTEVIVNEKFGEKIGLTSSEELVGKNFEASDGVIKATIVGVVKDFHNDRFTEEISPVFIADIDWYTEMAIKVDHQNIKSVVGQIEEKWSETYTGYTYEYRFLDDRVAEQYEAEQRYLSVSKAFSGLAILIGCLGLYGLILFFVGQRTKEIGIRKVLGSNVASILALLSKDFLKLILIAGAIATPITWYFMGKWLQGYTYRTEIQWWYFVIAIVAIILITLVTIGHQTLKAARTNPVKSLRSE